MDEDGLKTGEDNYPRQFSRSEADREKIKIIDPNLAFFF